MELTEAATLDRKSGEADLSRPPRLAVGRAVEWDLQFSNQQPVSKGLRNRSHVR